jgi:hypothetical protein
MCLAALQVRHSVVLLPGCGSSLHGLLHRRVWNPVRITWPQVPIVLMNVLGTELAVPGVEKIVRAEVRRYVWADTDFLICCHPEDLTTWLTQKLGLVAGALTRRVIEGDNVLFLSSVVTFHKLGPYADDPLLPKCIHLTTTMPP